MIVQSEAVFPAQIFDSREALETYLGEVKERRSQRRAEREQRMLLQFALQRLGEELTAAEQDEDAEITAELRQALAECEIRLSRLTAGTFVPSEAERTLAETTVPAPESLSFFPAPIVLEAPPSAEAERAVVCVAETHTTAPESVFSEPARLETPPPANGMQAKSLAAFRAEIEGLSGQFQAIFAEGLAYPDGSHNRSLCFRLRALASQLCGIQARAASARLDGALMGDFQEVWNALEMERAYASEGFAAPCFEADYRHCEAGILPEQWESLAQGYAGAAEAETAWEWHRTQNEEADLLPLSYRSGTLNAIAAAQQILYRALAHFATEDTLQTEAYSLLRQAAKKAGYLSALSPDIADTALEAETRSLSERLLALQWEWERNAESLRLAREQETLRKQKAASKEAALSDFRALLQRLPALGKAAGSLAGDRKELLPILDRCIEANVPPTNVEVRNALLETGTRLLEGQPKYSRILDAILAERLRKGMDRRVSPGEEADETEEPEPPDTTIQEYLNVVSPFVKDFRILILGGSPRQHVSEELKAMLGCAEVKWRDSKRSDKASKFEADIRKSNMLLLLKNFAGHDMSEKGREWIRSVGGHFVYIPSGYGRNQLINQLYKYVTSKEGRM